MSQKLCLKHVTMNPCRHPHSTNDADHMLNVDRVRLDQFDPTRRTLNMESIDIPCHHIQLYNHNNRFHFALSRFYKLQFIKIDENRRTHRWGMGPHSDRIRLYHMFYRYTHQDSHNESLGRGLRPMFLYTPPYRL